MKKMILAAALSIIMAFSCLTACSESSSTADSSKTESSKTESITASSIETVSPVDDVPEDPASEPDDGYWHEDTTTTATTTTTTTTTTTATTTKATTKAAPKYDYSVFKKFIDDAINGPYNLEIPAKTYYFLFDMNNDGIKEFIKYSSIGDDSSAQIAVYIYNNGSPKYICASDINMAHSLYFGYSDNKLEMVDIEQVSETDYAYVKTAFSIVNGSYNLKKEYVITLSKRYKDRNECIKDGIASMKHSLKVYKAINDDGTPNYSGLV